MSDNNKFAELKNNELEKASGGKVLDGKSLAKYDIYKVYCSNNFVAIDSTKKNSCANCTHISRSKTLCCQMSTPDLSNETTLII